ncbi:MAG: hypothetical protein JSS93_04210 [Bacteroidetes bacterium]|nr:hypothetical protein [Bacteroidota bacterium]
METVRELLNAIVSVSVTANSKLTKEQCYSTYILRQLYMKLRTKENRILDLGKTKGKIKIDSVQALVLVDVLQYCHQTLRLSSFLMDIGTILPIVFKSI